MNFRFLFLVIIFFTILFVSCEADVDLSNISNEVSLHPDLIVPIGAASVSLGQIISKNDSSGRFLIGDDSEINYFRIDSSEFKFPVLNLLQNSKELIKNINLTPLGIVVPPNSTLPTVSFNDIIDLGINNDKNVDRIDSILVKSAIISIIIDVSSDLESINPYDLTFSIVFPNGKIRMLNGNSSTINFKPIGYGIPSDIVLSNFMMSTSGKESELPIEVMLNAKTGALPLILSSASKVVNKISFKQLDYSVVYGNFKSGFNLSNSFQQGIDLDNDLSTGLLKFANPQVYISAISNVGMYLNFRIDYIKAFLSTNQNVNPVFADFNGSKFTDFELKRKPAYPGDTVHLNLPTLNKDWGATNLFFEDESKSDMLQYNFTASVDTLSALNEKLPSYITSDAKIKVKINTIIPLNFSKGSYYEYTDTISNIFVAIANALNQFPYSNITSTALILNITNGLPVKTSFTFDLTDSLGKVLPTSFEKNYVIEAGKVDGNGIVQPGKETKQNLQLVVTKEQLEILKKARDLTYKVRIEGNDINSNIHFVKSNTFDLKAGLFVKGDVNTTISTKTQK